MKKFIRGAVVLGMILCLSVTALAAPVDPSETSLCEIDMTSVKGPDGEPVELEITDVEEGIVYVEYGEPVDFSSKDEDAEVSVVYMKDIKSETLPVTITFEVPTADDNDVLRVMHYDGDTERWEKIAEGKGSSITATFTSLSPVAVVLEHPSDEPTPGPGPISPVTGEAPILLAAAVVALLAGTVAVVAVKKKEM